MERNIPYIEIIPDNSDGLTGPDERNEETSSKGIVIFLLVLILINMP